MAFKLLMPFALLLVSGHSAFASDVPGVREALRKMDLNGDRSIQFSEISAARARLFERLDTNRNGILDESEIHAVLKEANLARETTERLSNLADHAVAMDTDGDGRITRAEFSNFIPDRIRRADRNGDGQLSLRELRTLRRR